MPSPTYLPTLAQGANLLLQKTFFELAQQKQSKLQASGAIMFLPSDGKTNNLARMGGGYELVEVNTRNPDKQIADYAIDNRNFRKRRFTKTFQIDALYDINELIQDPTSSLLQQLDYARQRLMDRIAVQAAIGTVTVGAPDATGSSISAATDGVITVDASSTGLTYEKIQEITENFINNDVFDIAQRGTTLCIAGSENTDLMSEEEFINNDYMQSKPIEQSYRDKVGMYKIALFAGSKSGGITVTNPILTEGTTYRSCVVMAPDSVAMAMKLDVMNVKESPNKVNSWDLTIDFWINAMRTEGPRVQIVTTTI
jgi:hypothetical protein